MQKPKKCGLNIELKKMHSWTTQGLQPLCPVWSGWFQTTKPNSKTTARAQLDFLTETHQTWLSSKGPPRKPQEVIQMLNKQLYAEGRLIILA